MREERAWLALHEALSWVKTNASIDGALPGPLSDAEAWLSIRDAAADKKVNLYGVRLDRRGNNPFSNPTGDPVLIPAVVVGALCPIESPVGDGSLALASEALRATMRASYVLATDGFPGVFWTSVTVSGSDLVHKFLLRETKQSTASVRTDGDRSVAKTEKPKGRDSAAIWEAALVEWPDGRPAEFASTPTRTKRRLMPILVDMGHVASLQSSYPHPKTFGRALKNYPVKQDN